MWVNWFLHTHSKTYYCAMEMELIDTEKKQIILEDGSQFFYSVKPVEITNLLGNAVAVLDEYFITNSSVETYKLYKTEEGNWYDVPKTNKGDDKGVLMELKIGIDNEKKSI